MKDYKIGVISDTHGLLRHEVLEIFKEVDIIIHAGDVGNSSIIQQLKDIAPVVVVRGNCDGGELGYILKKTEVAQVGKAIIYVLHNLDELDLEPKEAGFNIVISGHSHMPRNESIDGVMYFNPGSAGPRRFKLPISLGMIYVNDDEIRGEFIEIPAK
ncbi:metallophosphoesterase family protein [Clostridium botulinum]|uniref:Phosphoesterase n=1 Tax=Clostridium botulinum TaxID=1491 RepID=A0A9Q1V1H6_CLOBO|nr:metallophosphoesterase family protein [Clostridium botulinum]AEB75197.1 phosphoesterase, putative subfamily [Clostridium botulinum BKT015925]KEI03346.1 phosphodiesterase [Clostridium botulinum D str. 16868]KEI05422.1 phosphodiesterase [Clostridium botulinum C/D str. Sp77]KLU75171.1 phosphodiesterase [Clostridium botulinum V891]KOA73342.1 phosphodiesterase [Clostridium botulinum]